MIIRIERGSPISFSVDVVEGQAADVTAIAAHLRSIAGFDTRPLANAPIAAVLVVSPRAASVEWPEGWTVFLGSAATKQLATGKYRLDVSATIAGEHWNRGGVTIEIVEPATVI